MYCYKCGAENKDDSQFCKECGTKLKETESGIANTETPKTSYYRPREKTCFDDELETLKQKVMHAKSDGELDYIRRTNQKKYWWTSIFICGLFYGLNGKIGKMILSWIIAIFTFGIYALYLIYTSYKDEKIFNDEMEWFILQRKKELLED